jgi:catechol 2,3-dioxygenase
MPVRPPSFNPPFNVVRASHVGVRDLAKSRAFYVDCLGYLVTDAHKDALYLRGVEERNHHSILLSTAGAQLNDPQNSHCKDP